MPNFFEQTDLSVSQQKVLHSALVLFVEKGFFNTSIPDLVAHSNVSTGSIYHAFRNKEAVAQLLVEQLLQQIEAQQAKILEESIGSRQRFAAMVAWKFQMTEDYPHMMQFIINARHREFMPEMAPMCSSKPFLILREVIKEGQLEGVVREMDPMVATAAAFGGPIRLMQLHLDGMLEKPLQHYLQEIIETSWKGIAN